MTMVQNLSWTARMVQNEYESVVSQSTQKPPARKGILILKEMHELTKLRGPTARLRVSHQLILYLVCTNSRQFAPRLTAVVAIGMIAMALDSTTTITAMIVIIINSAKL